MEQFADLNVPERTLLGPGPSGVDPRVLRAMSAPVIGHLDPVFFRVMNETMELLRGVFETRNELTLPISGTGSAGMEAAVVNLLEPGDRAVIGVHGLFGARLADAAERSGAKVVKVEAPWGSPLDPQALEAALAGGAKLLAVVHAETSTGVLQPLEPVAALARRHGALLLVDAVTSLGGLPVKVDALGIDACFAGTQKCLSAPPGLAPFTAGARALAALDARKAKVASWYLDLTMVRSYWGTERFYHHTAPVTMIYGLREALRLIAEEGLEARYLRHVETWQALVRGLEALGLELLVEREHRLPTLTAVRVPPGVDEAAVRRRLLEQYNIEIGGGLGPLKGKIWRIGLMGHSCRRRHVENLLVALAACLGRKADAALETARGA